MAVIFNTYMLCQILAATNDPTISPTYEPTVEPTAEPTIEPTINPSNQPTVGSLDYSYTKSMFITLAIESEYMTLDIIDIIEDELELKSSVDDNYVLADIYDYIIKETEPKPNTTRYDIRINITIDATDPITFDETEFIDITSIEDQIEDLDLSGNDINVLNISASWESPESSDGTTKDSTWEQLMTGFNLTWMLIFIVLICCICLQCCCIICMNKHHVKAELKRAEARMGKGYEKAGKGPLQLDPTIVTNTNTTEPSSYAEDRTPVLSRIDEESDLEVIKHESEAPKLSDAVLMYVNQPLIGNGNISESESESESEAEPEPEEAEEIVIKVGVNLSIKDPAEDIPDTLQDAVDHEDEYKLNESFKEVMRASSNPNEIPSPDSKEIIVQDSLSPSNKAETQGNTARRAGEPSIIGGKGLPMNTSDKSIASIPQCYSEGQLKMPSDHNM